MEVRRTATPLALTCAALLALSAASSARAVMLNPRGTGQVLLYPYYTVNQHQQTLLSVVNTTDHGKLLQLEVYEGYNGRMVMDLVVPLAPHDTWSATLFAAGDAGLPGTGAMITTADGSCIFPESYNWTGTLPSGAPYQALLGYDYAGSNADTGPTDAARTREGWFAVYEMAEVVGDGVVNLVPPPGRARDCYAALPRDNNGDSRGGLYGSAAVVDVGQGTLYAYAADALEAFTAWRLKSDLAVFLPNLPRASSYIDATGFHTVADVLVGGSIRQSDYVVAGSSNYLEGGVDAVSAVLDAQAVYAEYDRTAAAGVQSEWVLTFPTKPYYTDRKRYYGGTPSPTSPPPPFVEWFGQTAPGKSCVRYEFTARDREAAEAPFPRPPRPPLCTVTQVLTFRNASDATADPTSRVLGSTLAVNVDPGFASGSAVLNLDPDAEPHRLRPDAHGVQMRGLPVIGFEAINYINANVTPGVLANYSAARRLRTSAACVQANGSACE